MACGGSGIPEPVEPPPRVEQPRSERTPQVEPDAPELVAPPPAYGNKVVMARGAQAAARDL